MSAEGLRRAIAANHRPVETIFLTQRIVLPRNTTYVVEKITQDEEGMTIVDVRIEQPVKGKKGKK
jgi:hypothetical protein